ncbi:hypothetical protein POM88_013232 [Heracleum sosnowskyi]|uniref:Secreted protein n=1 Tax=Heracleum sosnowskyi TaxID=360622 RepID=A0AAD8IYU2_9APIA|nr:hypothetical protein POM88_013232 [Heracleum sosnowskyi]
MKATGSCLLFSVFFWCSIQLPMLLHCDYMTNSSYTCEVDHGRPPDIPLAPDCQSMQAFSLATRNRLVTTDFFCGRYRKGCSAASSPRSVVAIVSTFNNQTRRWSKLGAALKWGMSIRRDADTKRMTRLLYHDF